MPRRSRMIRKLAARHHGPQNRRARPRNANKLEADGTRLADISAWEKGYNGVVIGISDGSAGDA